jgi:hypothetical protein
MKTTSAGVVPVRIRIITRIRARHGKDVSGEERQDTRRRERLAKRKVVDAGGNSRRSYSLLVL